MERIELSEAWEQMFSYGPAVWIGVLCGIGTFIVEIILCQKRIIFGGAEKKREEAIKAGNVLQGTQVSCRYEDKSSNSRAVSRKYFAWYEYNLNGKTKKKQVISTSIMPPRTITLYYLSSSGKVFSEYDMGRNPLKVLLYIVPVAIAIFVMKLLGYTG